MRILFVLRHPGYTRNFESVLRRLAERGHRVHLAIERERADNPESPSQSPLLARLCAEYPDLSSGPAPGREDDGWWPVARACRQTRDYLRYLRPPYREAARLRQRAAGWAPRVVCRLARWPLTGTRPGLAVLDGLARWLEQAVPASRAIEAFVREHHPDLVLVTPLVEPGSAQPDYLLAARRLGIRSGLCVYSWDNLTNKGLIRESPDLVTVWNEAQKREAVELHGVPPERVVATGASAYDHWFAWSPSAGREAFCRKVGLPADRPFLLYLCSSPFIAPDEAAFVRRWVAETRARGSEALRRAGVLVRPHPQNAAQWQAVELSDLEHVALWPREGADPVTPQAKADYYDSIYHSAAVVGVNTSALIESAIVGRSVCTLLAPEFRATQEGTLHFRHLLATNGGPLHVATSFDEHAAQLAAAIEGGILAEERNRRFVERFVRPAGLDVSATEQLVAALEGLCGGPAPRRWVRPLPAALLQFAVTPLVRAFEVARPRWEHASAAPGSLGEAAR